MGDGKVGTKGKDYCDWKLALTALERVQAVCWLKGRCATSMLIARRYNGMEFELAA